MRKDQIRSQGQRSRSNTNDFNRELISCILAPWKFIYCRV